MQRIQLTRGYETIIDDDVFDLYGSWRWIVRVSRYKTKAYPYAMACRNGKVHHLHRLILNANLGEYVDHKNGDTLDNRRENLRLCTHKQNRRNEGMSSDNTSGFKGVTRGSLSTWRAQICINYKVTYLGSFGTKEEAARAYDAAASEHFGEYARLNFPVDHV